MRGGTWLPRCPVRRCGSSAASGGGAGVNITQEGDFYEAEYKYKLTPLWLVKPLVSLGAGVGKI